MQPGRRFLLTGALISALAVASSAFVTARSDQASGAPQTAGDRDGQAASDKETLQLLSWSSRTAGRKKSIGWEPKTQG